MARPRILITRPWPEAAERRVAELGDLTVNGGGAVLTPAAMAAALSDYDVICPTVTDSLPASVWPAAPRVRMLCNFGVGVNHIDLEAAKAHGVTVSNTPDVLTEATAEIALTLLLMISRRAGEGERQVRSGAWAGWSPTQLMGRLLAGKTVGVVGFGRIGQSFARKAHAALGMRVVYHSRHPVDPAIVAETGAVYEPSLDRLLQASDAVSLHMPGGDQTRHLIGAARLARMKPGAFLINTARGTVVDETALIAALQTGAIAGAGLDVYEHEPQVPAALTALENVVLLPHLGSATLETRVEMGLRAAENLEAFLQGRPLRDRVA